MSAAGRGRPPQAAARRPALRKRREGCNDRTIGRIDCPVVPERPPSGQLVSGSGQAGVGGHAGVRGGLTPGQMCSASGRLPPTVTSVATGVGIAAAPRTDNSCSAWPDTGREPPRPGPATHRVPPARDRVYAVARGHHLIFGCAHTTGSSTVAALVCSPKPARPEQPDNDLRLEY
jgi:hypothetical protein